MNFFAVNDDKRFAASTADKAKTIITTIDTIFNAMDCASKWSCGKYPAEFVVFESTNDHISAHFKYVCKEALKDIKNLIEGIAGGNMTSIKVTHYESYGYFEVYFIIYNSNYSEYLTKFNAMPERIRAKLTKKLPHAYVIDKHLEMPEKGLFYA